SFQSALTLLSFVLPVRVDDLQDGNDVRLRTNFSAADCSCIPANWRCSYAVLCASRNSSKCDFVFVDPNGANRRNLFLEIGADSLAAHHRTAFLLFAAVVQHSRRHVCVRGWE